MGTYRRKVLVAVLCVVILGIARVGAAQEATPKIQLAILLDTSNSMDGLIAQAKSKLWSIVNEFATTKKDGKIPDFQVALFEYGNDRLPQGEGYIRLVLPLTDDLDKVSEELFALKTNGGSEYCGHVIQEATGQLLWSDAADDLKVIFIAGNEPFTQGGVDFHKSCAAAAAKDIVVNTIFCGNHDEGVNTSWRDGATLADGVYMNIDQNASVVSIPAPQDEELAKLGVALNDTYIPYGAEGKRGYANQTAQDTNASSLGGSAMVERSVAKNSAQYRNASWDLVDAIKENAVELKDVKDADLPEEMRKMTLEERNAYIEKRLAERAEIQAKAKALAAEREKFIIAEQKKLGDKGADTFDLAVTDVLHRQAVEKNFNFEK